MQFVTRPTNLYSQTLMLSLNYIHPVWGGPLRIHKLPRLLLDGDVAPDLEVHQNRRVPGGAS